MLFLFYWICWCCCWNKTGGYPDKVVWLHSSVEDRPASRLIQLHFMWVRWTGCAYNSTPTYQYTSEKTNKTLSFLCILPQDQTIWKKMSLIDPILVLFGSMFTKRLREIDNLGVWWWLWLFIFTSVTNFPQICFCLLVSLCHWLYSCLFGHRSFAFHRYFRLIHQREQHTASTSSVWIIHYTAEWWTPQVFHQLAVVSFNFYFLIWQKSVTQQTFT